jgi:hypothetical protein
MNGVWQAPRLHDFSYGEENTTSCLWAGDCLEGGHKGRPYNPDDSLTGI